MLNWRTILQMEWAMTYRGYLFRFNEVIIVLCAELNLTSNYGFIKDEIFLFKMRFFPFYTQISNWKVSRSETYVLCTYVLRICTKSETKHDRHDGMYVPLEKTYINQ